MKNFKLEQNVLARQGRQPNECIVMHLSIYLLWILQHACFASSFASLKSVLSKNTTCASKTMSHVSFHKCPLYLPMGWERPSK
jgi:hypothetical protein